MPSKRDSSSLADGARRRLLRRLTLPLVLAAAAGACVVDPEVDPLPEAGDERRPDGSLATPSFQAANTVWFYTEGDLVHSCADDVVGCEPQSSALCPTQLAALGPRDGAAFTINPNGRLELGFRCGAILERGDLGSIDFYVYGHGSTEARAIVEVSEDGGEFHAIGYASGPESGFDLETVGLRAARFIRLTAPPDQPVAIDAVTTPQ